MAMAPLDAWLVRRMGWRDPSVLPTPDDIRRWQIVRLREVIEFARANSPFYARHLSEVDTSAIRSAEDFSRLPTMTPDHVREAPEQLLCVSQDAIARIVTLRSSGTTGRPKRIFHTTDDIEATVEYFGWGMRNLVREGQTAFVLMPGERPGGVGRLLADALDRTGARAVVHGVLTDVREAVDHILEEKADCIVGSAAHVNMVAREWEARGLPSGKIRSVLLCWDMAPDTVVHHVTRIFGCAVLRHWGMIETCLGGAVECTPGSGMHLREPDVFLEIIDSATGHVLPDGEFGEMVISTPLKRGMPLIRYRTGDIGRILPGDCMCGSPLRRLDPCVRREGDECETLCGPVRLGEVNEALYDVPGLFDFAARLDNGVLHVVACGTSQELAERVEKALELIPVIAKGLESEHLELDITIRSALAPAVPGLGKRRLHGYQE